MENKIRLEIDLDVDANRYEIRFKKMDDKNFEMNWNHIKPVLEKIIKEVDKQVTDAGLDSTDEFTKMIH